MKHDRSSMDGRGDRRGPASLAALCLGALLIGLLLALPFGHELFHEHEGEAGPESCPVCMIESSPVLLVVVILALPFVSAGTRIRRGTPWSVPLPLFYRGYSFANRAPPRS